MAQLLCQKLAMCKSCLAMPHFRAPSLFHQSSLLLFQLHTRADMVSHGGGGVTLRCLDLATASISARIGVAAAVITALVVMALVDTAHTLGVGPHVQAGATSAPDAPA